MEKIAGIYIITRFIGRFIFQAKKFPCKSKPGKIYKPGYSSTNGSGHRSGYGGIAFNFTGIADVHAYSIQNISFGN